MVPLLDPIPALATGDFSADLPTQAIDWIDSQATGEPRCVLRTLGLMAWGNATIWTSTVVDRITGRSQVANWDGTTGERVELGPGISYQQALTLLERQDPLDGSVVLSASAVEASSVAPAWSREADTPVVPDSVDGDGLVSAWRINLGSPQGYPGRAYVIRSDGWLSGVHHLSFSVCCGDVRLDDADGVQPGAIDSTAAVQAATAEGWRPARASYHLSGGNDFLRGEDTWILVGAGAASATLVADGSACVSGCHDSPAVLKELGKARVANVTLETSEVPIGGRARIRVTLDVERDGWIDLPLVVDGRTAEVAEAYVASDGADQWWFEPRFDSAGEHTVLVGDADPVGVTVHVPERIRLESARLDPADLHNGTVATVHWAVRNIGGRTGSASVEPIVVADHPHVFDPDHLDVVTNHLRTEYAFLQPGERLEGNATFRVHSLRPVDVQLLVNGYEEWRVVVTPT